jgi:hypothetical protein
MHSGTTPGGEGNILQEELKEDQNSGPFILKEFLKRIEAKDGQGFEAMEVGLAHALKEIKDPEDGVPVSLIIILGDAPPNKTVGFIELKKKFDDAKFDDMKPIEAIQNKIFKPHDKWTE